ncbi:HNH endonuclease [Lutimaribacter sp. EGI FJ00015]|uniref:HNH endonuclease n=1 Tax=Lutimaribacter degradans TaxID=2945989 RepID=A0ACC5ZTZ3_9RHOB|nr:HNH endonuclease [Lutimaribacter sp. EGI FJ00013]MCM2561767.1 HNH endonuclease [Lutimaribacter sp. EGI FJ00013]MCO0613201.1 HNH endonuclease [Lutimaribacter sp. EGI FJ00015]MCO0635599.1 HNH endonuclease [Lutimaribacter sp. EGI FJ00014]
MQDVTQETGPGGHPVCALCGREVPPDAPQSWHHLIPKLKGGKGGPVVLLHHICHKEIHATLSEAELARAYNTPEALRAHPRLARFAAWVVRRPPGFLSKVPGRRRGR